MSTVTIVVVGIWNALLLTALAAAIYWRKRVFQWITQLDGQNRNLWETGTKRSFAPSGAGRSQACPSAALAGDPGAPAPCRP
jgi:hypothetical protein